MSQKISFSFILILGFMLFSMFFGAGNLIFPPMLGSSAGTNVWIVNAGFLVTGVGLPLLGVIAFVFSGKKDLQSFVGHAHPLFGIVFSVILYLAIGPFFAIPRAGNVSFVIGVEPFLTNQASTVPLIIFTIIFFTVACLLSFNPNKIVQILGKILTPIKLTFISALVVTAVIHPIGEFQSPTSEYTTNVFLKGFQEGYLTLDALVAFVFGIIIVNAVREKGVTRKKQILITCTKSTLIAAMLLALIYSALAYMGATSVGELGHLNNGAEILAKVSNYYFGSAGKIILGLLITIACMTTCVGLITVCATFFHTIYPKVSYRMFAIILSVFSAIVANVGLNTLIAISVPVLQTLYPIAICLMLLTFLHSLFNGRSEVYQGSLLLTFVVSLFDGLNAAGIEVEVINNLFTKFLPMYNLGLGWLCPAIIGGIFGYFYSVLWKKQLRSTETLPME